MAVRARPVSAAVARSHAARIFTSRAATGRDMTDFPDPEHELDRVVDYVMRNPHPVTARQRDDLLSCLYILDHLRGHIEARTVDVIAAARKRKVTWREIAVPIGAKSYQSAEQTYLRLSQAANGEPRNERDVRAMRAHTRAMTAARIEGVSLRALVVELLDPAAQLPAEVNADAEELFEELLEIPEGEEPSREVIAAARNLLHTLILNYPLVDPLRSVVIRGGKLLRVNVSHLAK